jgi:hypothetical protein
VKEEEEDGKEGSGSCESNERDDEHPSTEQPKLSTAIKLCPTIRRNNERSNADRSIEAQVLNSQPNSKPSTRRKELQEERRASMDR